MGNDMLSPIRILFCGADVFMLYVFFSAIFQKKWEGKKLLLVSSVITIIIFFENSFCNANLNLLVIPPIYFIYVLLVFEVSVGNAAAYVIIFYSFISNGEFIYTLVYSLLEHISPFKLSPWYTSDGIYCLIIFYLANFIVLSYIEKHIKKLEIGNNDKLSFYLLIVPVLSIIATTKFIYNDITESIAVQIFISLLFWLSNAVTFIILEKYTDIMNKIRYSELCEIKSNMENQHLQKTLKVNESYQCYIHDIHSHFNNFRMLALNNENEKIINIINELEGKIHNEVISEIYNSNPVLNAILSERISMAKEKNVKLSLFVENFLKVDFISDSDMVSMFGNLLDNAIEAAGKCSLNNRKVNVKMYMGTNYFFVLYIENSYAVSAEKVKGRMLSTKENSSCHGLGVGIVRSLVNKYGGTLNLVEKGDLFVTTLAISTCVTNNNCAS